LIEERSLLIFSPDGSAELSVFLAGRGPIHKVRIKPATATAIIKMITNHWFDRFGCFLKGSYIDLSLYLYVRLDLPLGLDILEFIF